MDKTLIAILLHSTGVFISGSLYLVLTFVGGLAYGNRYAVILSVLSAGLAYLGAQFHLFSYEQYGFVLVVMAIAAGVLAGLLLAIL